MSYSSSKTAIISLLSLSIVGMYGCSAEEDFVPRDIEAEWNSFRSSVYHEQRPNGKFIVEWDLPISNEEKLRQYFFAYVAGIGQPLTVRTAFGADVTWENNNKFSLTYCISDTFGGKKADTITAMALANSSWSDRIAVRFQYMPEEDAHCTSANANVTFDINPVSDSYFARSFFPNDVRAQRNILITDAAFTTIDGGRDLQGILRHELGHILGFRHEHIWTAACATEATADARQVTEYDVNSVMHYPQCRPSMAGGYRQTETDYRGAVSLYGLAPALIVASLSAL